MDHTPSLSEQIYTKTSGPVAPITTQPTPGAGRSFIHGVSMPANANAAHQSGASLRVRGGGAAKDCCIGVLATFVCSECCEGLCDCIADVLCCPCEMLGY